MIFSRVPSLDHRHCSDDEAGDGGSRQPQLSLRIGLSLLLSAAGDILNHSALRRVSSRPAALLILLLLSLLLLAAAVWPLASSGFGLPSALPSSLFPSSAAAAVSPSSLPPCPPAVFLDELPSPFPYSNLSHPCTHSLLRSGSSPRQYPRYVYPVHSFLIAFPRSGTSLIRRILEQHTGVLTGSAYPDRQQAAVSGSAGQKLRSSLLIAHHFVNRNDSQLPALHPFLDTSLIFSAKDGRGRFGIERLLYVVRDPMAVLVSLYLLLALEAQEAVADHLPYHRFIEHLRAWLPVWSQHVRHFTSTFLLTDCRDCELLVVRYEDVLAFPDPSDARSPTAAMLCFLGFGPDDARHCRSTDGSGGAEDDEEPDADGRVDDGPLYSSKTRRSLFNPNVIIARNVSYGEEIFSHLSPEMIRLFDHIAGIEMRAFGYWPLPD